MKAGVHGWFLNCLDAFGLDSCEVVLSGHGSACFDPVKNGFPI